MAPKAKSTALADIHKRISTKDNPADLFTKSTLDMSTFSRHAKTVKNE